MDTHSSKKRLNAQILEEAVEWFVDFSAGDVDPVARQRFDLWLRTSPEHLRAYLELLPIWEDGALPPPGHDPNPDRLIAWAQRHDRNIVPFESRSTVTTGNLTSVQITDDAALPRSQQSYIEQFASRARNS